MSKPLSDERLAEIRTRVLSVREVELLAEVDRLRAAAEKADELIRDAMDITVGFCSPTTRANALQVIERVLISALDSLSDVSLGER